jgi:DNA-binding beta-propeller fold protein YncE
MQQAMLAMPRLCGWQATLAIVSTLAWAASCAGGVNGQSDLAAADLSSGGPVDFAVAPPTVLSGFAYPWAVAWDADSSAWFVANRIIPPAGVPVKSGTAYLSRIAADLSRVDVRWLSGLNAPAGLAVASGKLYLADADEILVIDIASQAVQKRTAVAGVAAYLNGLALDSVAGRAYLADSGGNQIWSYSIPSATSSLLVKSPSLASPQGLAVVGANLIAVSAGSGGGNGTISSIELLSGSLSTLGSFRGNLVGLAYDPNNLCYLVGDAALAFVSRVDLLGGRSVPARNFAADGLQAVAGLAFDPLASRLAVTDPLGNRVAIFSLPLHDSFW